MSASRDRYRKLARYAARETPTLALLLALAFGLSAATALQPWPTKLLVDYALSDLEPPAMVRALFEGLGVAATPLALVVLAAAASVAFFASSALLDVAVRRLWSSAGQRMVYRLAGDLFAHLQRLNLAYHRRQRTGDLLQRMATDSWCVYGICESLLVSPMQQVLTIGVIAAAAWQLDPPLTLLALAFAPLLGVSAAFFGRRVKQRARDHREASSRLTSFVHATLDAVPLVQAFGAEPRNRARFEELAAETVTVSQRSHFLESSYGLANGLALTLGAALVLYAGGLRAIEGELTVGTLVVFLAYMRSLQGAFRSLGGTYGRVRAIEASVDRVFEVLESGEAVEERPSALDRRVSRAPELRFEGVRFGYQSGGEVLHGIDLVARPGEMLALVGPTGAGKTTLVSLIPRLFDPWEGRVLLDGCDVRDLTLRSLRDAVSIVLQDPCLVHGTVADNIAFGRPGASRAEVEEAARAANADGFIREMSSGYDTALDRTSLTLSRGEQQRLALARALLRDPAILVLDEPTSALDADSERLLVEALEGLSGDCTILCIAHRLATVERAHQVAVLEAGRIVQLGAPGLLLRQPGPYRKLHALGFGSAPGWLPAA